MSSRRILISTIVIILSTALLVSGFHPSHSAPVWAVALDANSTSQTDVSVQSNCPSSLPLPGCPAQTKTFRIGAVINASTINPLTNVYGWQVVINYNYTLVVPQADPDPATSYPDGAGNTVSFGAQTTVGAFNWAGAITAGQAFGSITISQPGTAYVVFTFLPPHSEVTLSTSTLLANVAFEALNKTVTPQAFSVSTVKFVDVNANELANVVAGASATETMTNDPPHASFSAGPIPNGDTSCAAVTGAACSKYAFRLDGSASADSDGTIASPTGYFWDFGDGTQDSVNSVATCPILNCNQGSVAIHDYGVPGSFATTLRVVDDQGATGSARDVLGGAIFNGQPSHAYKIVIADIPPQPSFTFSPANPLTMATVSFDASASLDPDGTITKYAWDFGNGATASGVTSTTAYATPGTYIVTLTATDDLGVMNSTTRSVIVTLPLGASISVTPTSPIQGSPATFTASATGGTPPYTSYVWNFGDGSPTASGITTTHSYANTGTFTVTLTVTDSLSSSFLTSKSVTVVADAPPSVTFTPPTNSIAGQALTLTLSMSDPDGTVTGVRIDWGDGNVTSYTGSLSSATHAYAASGTFVITVTATDNGGKTGSKSSTIIVAQAPAPPPNQTGLLEGPIPYIIIAIVAAGIVAFLVIRRRKPKQQISTSGPQ